VHLNEIVSQVRTGGDAIDLAIAAKYLGVNYLEQESAVLLEPFVTVLNVWDILEYLISGGLKTAAQACSDVICHFLQLLFLFLSSDMIPQTLTLLTTDSINNPAALKVSERCIMYALELQNFNVTTEMEIVDFCVNWAANNPDCV
jgi:hypothetical protein